jgi:PAS domain S-box-containing protein
LIDLRDFYSALVQNSDDAIIAKDADGIVLSWNAAAERLYGWTEEEMVGQSMRRVLPDDRRDEEDRIFNRIRRGERVGQFFTKRLHKSGKLLDVSVTVSPVCNAEGAVIGASKIARDASAILENQRRLRESERHFRMLADNISQLAWIARGDGHLLWYNRQWYDYTGTKPEEVQGRGWAAVHHPDHIERVSAHYFEAIAAGVEWEDTFPLRRHDGEWRWFLSRAKPIRDEDDNLEFWFGTNTDITEEREQAEQIRLLLMEVNHRAKNLLGTVQALARRTAPDEKAFLKRFEDRIRSLAVNQDILVKREWRHVPVRELAEAQLAFVQQAPGEITFTGPDLSLVPRAAETIGMALHELATNALKYGALSIKGGHVDIGWSVRPGSTEDGQGGEAPGRFAMWWNESGGPPVSDAGPAGFGTRLIRDVPQHTLGAQVSLHHQPSGVCWEIDCPLELVSRPAGPG